jgi:hypothetical protein
LNAFIIATRGRAMAMSAILLSRRTLSPLKVRTSTCHDDVDVEEHGVIPKTNHGDGNIPILMGEVPLRELTSLSFALSVRPSAQRHVI